MFVLASCDQKIEDVTYEYFPAGAKYELGNNSTSSAQGSFIYLGDGLFFINEDSPTLPTIVNKVGTFEEHDMIQFVLDIEGSSDPDYDWSQHFDQESFTKKILDEEVTFVIKEMDYPENLLYLLVPVENFDQSEIEALLACDTLQELLEFPDSTEYYAVAIP